MAKKTKRSKKVKGKPAPTPAESQVIKLEVKESRLDQKDYLLCGSLMIAFILIGIWNIGSLSTPETSYAPAHENESFYFDLKNEHSLKYIYLMQGTAPKIEYQIYSGSPGNWKLLHSASRENFVLSWLSIPADSATRYVRFVAASPNSEISEVIFYTSNYKKIPVSADSVICESGNCSAGLTNLVDEQSGIEDPPSYLTGAYFDEIYFVRTAYEHIKHERPFEYTHPPLGKIFLGFGILIFGINAFGWRIVPLIFGTALIPLMYIFGKQIFNTRFGAFASAFLMCFESMHFVLSRIGMVDIILATFVLLMFYFFYTYYKGEFFKEGWKDAYLPLLLSGVFFGLAVSVKWVALYGAFAVLVLFLLLKREEMKKAARTRKSFFKPFFLFPLCIIFVSFVVISFIIYVLSYLPIMGIPGEGSGLDMVLRYQSNMLRYHSTLTATHPFSSSWWSWIFMLKPVWLYTQSNSFENTVSNIVAIGNPAIWWVSLPSLLFVAWIWIKENDSNARFIVVAFLLQLLTFAFIGRILFLYHMFLNVPFMIFAIVYGLNIMWQKENKYRYAVIAYLAFVIVVFIYFYPVLSALPISPEVNSAHKWLSSWIF